ncbi:MAG: ABC transporter substrate-binding protein [Thermoplasmataceae archaeon]
MNSNHLKKRGKFLILMAIVVALMFMIEPIYGNLGTNSNSHVSIANFSFVSNQGRSSSTVLGEKYNFATQTSSSSPTPWTAPTNTTQEPGYTGGTYKLAQIGNPDYLNAFEASTVCDFYILDNIYNSATQQLPNGTTTPCLATSYHESVAPANMTTFDPMTGAHSPVKYIWTVNIRSGVQWDDWTQANASDTYVYSNHTSFYNSTGTHFTHTYTTVYNATSGKNQSQGPITMKKYYVQSADFILSWKLLATSTLFSASYIDVVNVVPLNNTTVEYYLSGPSATFVPYTLETFILPYNVWVNHDYASNGSGLWNETPNLPASAGYNQWDLGHVSGSGSGLYPGLVGTGPFLMNGGYGQPMGKYFHDDYWQVYENPNYFMQYVTGNYSWLHKFIPKIYSEKVYIFSSPSAAVGALSTGQVDAIESSIPSVFLSTAEQIPHVNIYEKPSTGYAYFKFNSYSADAPFNITAFRQALRYDSPLGYVDSSICDGFFTPGYSILPAVDTPYYDGAVPQFSYNPTLANSTIAGIPGMSYKSGEWYYHGKQVTATIQSPSASLIPQIFTGYESIANDWSSIGIHTTVLSESFATIISKFDAYSNTGASPSASYNIITLGVSGLFGDPIGDLIGDYNYTASIGTGDYQGPFSTMNVSTPYSAALGLPQKVLNGTQIDSLMTNLSTYANTNASIIDTHYAIDAMQYIEDKESTMMPIGYGPTDIIAYSNATFAGIAHVVSDMNGFWEQNLFSVHLRSQALVTAPPTSHVVVTATTTKQLYYNGEYGNVTFSAVNNATGAPVSGSTIVVAPDPSLLNISSYTGVTNSAGQYRYEFRVFPDNSFINTADYSGLVNVSATVVSSISGVASGVGHTLINDMPEPVAYTVSGPSVLSSTSGYKYYNVTIYNPLTNTPISGYSYIIQALTAAVNMKTTSSQQFLSNLSTYDALCKFTSMAIPVNSTYNDSSVTSISGVTGSNGVISVMVEANSTFNYTLNGNTYESYIFMGDYALAAPMTGVKPYMPLGELTSSQNLNGFGTGEPFEIPMLIQKTANNYTIHITKKAINPTTTELQFMVTNGSNAVSGYNLNVTSQNALGANRGYFVDSSNSTINPNYYLVETCGAETGSQFEPMAKLTTNSNGMAYVNFTSLFYTYNSTTGAISPMALPSEIVLPFDEFQISAAGDGQASMASTEVISNASSFYNVSIIESGLKTGSTWSANLGTLSESSSTNTITFSVVNGTYSFLVEKVNYYNITENATGSVTVNGSSRTINVAFVYLAHNVSFVETGLSTGTTWNVTLNGVTMSSNGTTIVFVELNGTYSYTVGNVSGYTISSNATGSVNVTGKNVTVDVTFTPKVTAPNYTDYYIIAGVVVALVIIGGIAYYVTRGRKSKTNKNQ